LGALIALGSIIGACGGAGPSPPSAASLPAATQVASVASLPPTQSPSERLTTAFGALRAGYSFDTTLSVAGQIAAHVVGRRLGDASEMVIESGGASVTYRMLPPKSWVRKADGDWVEAEGQVPSGDPLTALLAPLTVADLPGGDGKLQVTYPASALGLAGADPIAVTVQIGSGGAISIAWGTSSGGRSQSSSSVFTPATGDPIEAPSVAPD
jgi:hypothetical protein